METLCETTMTLSGLSGWHYLPQQA